MIQETSKVNLFEIIQSGRLNDMEEVVFRAFCEHPMSTDKEIEAYTGLEINKITGRRNGLVDKGLMEECGVRECQVTHMNVLIWRPCDNKPKENIQREFLTDKQMENIGKKLRMLKDQGNDFQKNQIRKWVEECL